MSALTTSSQIWLTALQTAAHQVRQIAGCQSGTADGSTTGAADSAAQSQ